MPGRVGAPVVPGQDIPRRVVRVVQVADKQGPQGMVSRALRGVPDQALRARVIRIRAGDPVAGSLRQHHPVSAVQDIPQDDRLPEVTCFGVRQAGLPDGPADVIRREGGDAGSVRLRERGAGGIAGAG
ncbi:hypothetical protein, partial [Enterobacter cloacae]|uniref:hypothetical protein n=1 Tax=Enterobacter cloacae TaxID=550 RepID=UPI0021D271FF